MSLTLILSITLRLMAMGWSIVLLRRVRDWRMAFLTAMRHRKQLDSAVAESEAKTRAIVDNAADGIITIDGGHSLIQRGGGAHLRVIALHATGPRRAARSQSPRLGSGSSPCHV